MLDGNYVTPVFWSPYIIGFIFGVSSTHQAYRNTVVAYVAVVLVLLATFREGAACMAMATPLLLPLCLAGTFSGRLTGGIVKSRRARKTSAVLVFLALGGWQAAAMALDDARTHPWHEVRAAIDVGTTPDGVFALLTDPRGLEIGGAWPKVLDVGLPIPERMVVQTPGENGLIRFDFNHGKVEAKIVAWRPGRLLSFSPARFELDDPPFFHTRLGDGPHRGLKTERVTDWLTFGVLSYEIEPREGGGSRLTRVTRFQRHLFPSFYFENLQTAVIEAGSKSLLEKLGRRLEPEKAVAARAFRAP